MVLYNKLSLSFLKMTKFLLTIPEETWSSFKSKVTKDITLNEKIVSLIEGYSNE